MKPAASRVLPVLSFVQQQYSSSIHTLVYTALSILVVRLQGVLKYYTTVSDTSLPSVIDQVVQSVHVPDLFGYLKNGHQNGPIVVNIWYSAVQQLRESYMER